MRVFYICRCCNQERSGINKKISSQVKWLNKLGTDSYTVSICNEEEGPPRNPKNILVRTKSIFFHNSIIKKLVREKRFNEALNKTIQQLTDKDICYMRMNYPSRDFLKALRSPRKCKVIIEFQAVDPLDYRMERKFWYLPMDWISGSAIRKSCDGIVGVTRDVTNYQIQRAGNPTKPNITIGNGFDVESAPLRKTPRFDGTLRLLCVAMLGRWHGLDRVLKGMASNPELNVTLDIAGSGPEERRLKRLSLSLDLDDRVRFHGFIEGQELDALYDSCHIALGGLALHRKRLRQATALKDREYCSRGIPFISTVDDFDFPSSLPFIYRIPSSESPIDLQMVFHFAEEVYSIPSLAEDMRLYAFEKLDWRIKVDILRRFFLDVAGAKFTD